jgi:5-methylcytosine-specific restriction endonuclease McrA
MQYILFANANHSTHVGKEVHLSTRPAKGQPIELPSLDNYQGFSSLPTFKRAGNKFSKTEKDYVRALTEALLKIDPTLTVRKMYKYFDCRRGSYVAILGDLMEQFVVKHIPQKPLPKVPNYKPTRHFQKLRAIERLATARGVSSEECMVCGLKNHMGHTFKEIAEIDHINGVHSDNRPENLRIICPTCHTHCKTSSSSLKTPNLDLATADPKKANLYNSEAEVLANPTKKRRLDAQAQQGFRPFNAIPDGKLFRLYSPGEPEKKIASLGNRLLFDKKKPCSCSECNATTWRSLSIVPFLQVHHKDENRLNNNVDNLELLCANCHRLRHKEGLPQPQGFSPGTLDLRDPEVIKVREALGPELRRINMKKLAKDLDMPYGRMETIIKCAFRARWFPASEPYSEKDFKTAAGKKAIIVTLNALRQHGFHYDNTRRYLLRSTGENYVSGPFFDFIHKWFGKAWRRGDFITDFKLLSDADQITSEEQKNLDIEKVRKALGPELQRLNFAKMSKTLGIPHKRLKKIILDEFPDRWFTAAQPRSVRDFETVDGKRAIQATLNAYRRFNFDYKETMTFLGTAKGEDHVSQIFFRFINQHFIKAWRKGNFITDYTLLPDAPQITPEEQKNLDLEKVRKALGPELKRFNMQELAKSLGMPLSRLKHIVLTEFPERWFTIKDPWSPRDFGTAKGKQAIQATLNAYRRLNFDYKATRHFVTHAEREEYVPEILFRLISNYFRETWKKNNFVTDYTLLPPQPGSDQKNT